MPFNYQRLYAVLSANTLLRIAMTASGANAIIGFYLADLAREGHAIDSGVVGTMEAALNLAAFACAIPFGILIDRYSPRAILIVGAILGALATQLFALTGFITIFFVSRALEGAGNAATQPGILAHLTDSTQNARHLRGKVMSWFELTLFLGIAIGNLLSGALWNRFHTNSFAMLSIFYVLAAAVFWWGTAGEETQKKTHLTLRQALQGTRAAAADPALRRLAMPWFMFNAVTGLWLSQFAFLLSGPERAGQWLVGLMTPQQVAMFLFAYTIVFSIGVVIGGLAIGKVSRKLIMQWAFVAIFGSSIVFFLANISADWSTTARALLLPFYALAVLIQGGFTPAALSYLADLAGDSEGRGAAMGIYSLLLSLGNIVGALMSGWLGKPYAFNGLLFGTIIFAGLGLIGLKNLSEADVELNLHKEIQHGTN